MIIIMQHWKRICNFAPLDAWLNFSRVCTLYIHAYFRFSSLRKELLTSWSKKCENSVLRGIKSVYLPLFCTQQFTNSYHTENLLEEERIHLSNYYFIISSEEYLINRFLRYCKMMFYSWLSSSCYKSEIFRLLSMF